MYEESVFHFGGYVFLTIYFVGFFWLVMALTIRPSEPFPNLIKYDWNQPELISWFHQLSFVVEGTVTAVNDLSSLVSQVPLLSSENAGSSNSDLEGLGQISVPNFESTNVNIIRDFIQQAFSRGLIGGLSNPLNIQEEVDSPLTPICCL